MLKVSKIGRVNLLFAALWQSYKGLTPIIVKQNRERKVGELPWYHCGHLPASGHHYLSILSGIIFAKLIQAEKLNKSEYIG